METFPYVIKYKKRKENVVADALSRRHALITTMDAKVLGFEHIKMAYWEDPDFDSIYKECVREHLGHTTSMRVTCSVIRDCVFPRDQ